MSLARRILLLHSTVLLIVLSAVGLFSFLEAQAQIEKWTDDRVFSLCEGMAQSPGLPALLARKVPTGTEVPELSPALEDYARSASIASGSVVIISLPDGRMLTNPIPELIGQPFQGDLSADPLGSAATELLPTPWGDLLVQTVPIRDESELVVGWMTIGLDVKQVHAVSITIWIAFGLIVLGALLLGVVGTVFVNRWIRRHTLNMGPEELSRMFRYYDSVLNAVHEGMLLLDQGRRIVTVNTQARQMLGLTDAAVGHSAAAAGLSDAIQKVIDAPNSVTDTLVVTDDRVLAVTKRAAEQAGKDVGSVLILRDQTELESLSGELDRVHGFTDALRSQAHESANRLHTLVSLIELGHNDLALDTALGDLETAQSFADQVFGGIGDPAIAALLLAKSTQASERGIEFTVSTTGILSDGLVNAREVVLILGNLIDNAYEAMSVGGTARRVDLFMAVELDEFTILVRDTGPGLTENDIEKAFSAGWSTKEDGNGTGGRGLGLSLVRQAVSRCRGVISAEPGPGARFSVRLPIVRV